MRKRCSSSWAELGRDSSDRPAVISRVLGIVYRTLAAHLVCRAARHMPHSPHWSLRADRALWGISTFMVHMLVLEGVHVEPPNGLLHYRRVKAPTSVEVTVSAHMLGRDLGRNP